MRKTWRKDDPTKTAVKRQLHAMGLLRYELGLRDVATGCMVQRLWTTEDILTPKNLNWLKWMNRKGNGGRGSDMYIRGDRSVQMNLGLILVDDVQLGTLEQMEQDGLQPAVVVQTSPLNFQAWLRVSDSPLLPELATAAAKILANRYQGDSNSADWCHYGRLAGFTNRKPEHIQGNGLYPFVLFERGPGRMALQAHALLREAGVRVEAERQAQPLTLDRSDPLKASNLPLVEEQAAALAYFQQHWSQYLNECDRDESRADWRICCALAKGGYRAEAIHHALRHGSPNIEARKKGHLEGKKTAYVDLTVRNVLKQADILEARSQLQRQRNLQRDCPIQR